MKCVVLAAGRGSRLRDKGPSKPLIPIRGIPLIERVLGAAHAAAIGQFVVVSGYRGGDVRTALDAFAAGSGVSLQHVVNADWERGNGVSAARAEPFVDGVFLLIMGDHLFDPGVLRDLAAQPVEPETVTLAADFGVDDQMNDVAEATRVHCVGDRIREIGKMIAGFNAIDTGLFLCTRALFAALAESQNEGDDSLSGGMRVLAKRNRARVFDIGHRLWLDVDDAASLARAEELVAEGRI